ncbi:hypothetical protein [Pedobacter frigoris]|uniref:hypothetical protein n=1 Tax=Pedobacter frigoris TaxID=2571272 RepID=UPI00292EDF7F|nr:hypothetical protein [Pedobacter frigoris]
MAKYKDTKTIYLSLAKTLITGLALLIIGSYFIYTLLGKTFYEYVLLRFGESTSGYITTVYEDATDTDAGGVAFDFYYDYEFKLPNGKLIKGHDSEGGRIPDYLMNVDEEPYKMEVVYMKNDPEINKLKRALSHSAFTPLRRVIFSILISIFTLYLVFSVVKPGIRQYRQDREA